MSLSYLMVKMSPGLKDSLDSYCERHDIQKSHLVRLLISGVTGYDIAQDDYSMGPSQLSDRERENLRREAREKRKELVEAMMQDYTASEREEAYRALQDSLQRNRMKTRKEAQELEDYLSSS